MNEGCNGGFTMQNGLFGELGYFVTEKCAPYTSGSGEGKKFGMCGKYEKCEPHSKILKSYDVG